MIAVAISGGKSDAACSSNGLLRSERATAEMNGYSCEPKWLLASLGISAGRWSTQWNNILWSPSLASPILVKKLPALSLQSFSGTVALKSKNGSSMDVKLRVNSIDPS